MTCVKGGFIHRRHDDLRDLVADLMNETFNEVITEPGLQPLTGEVMKKGSNTSEEARLDIAARSFWQRGEMAFFDVRIFNPFAKCNQSQKLQKVFESQEKEKKRSYNHRVIQIEHGSFSPLVFSCYGGYGKETERALN